MSDPASVPDQTSSPLESTEGLFRLLQLWVVRGWLRPLDEALVRFFAERVPAADPLVLLATALASHQLGHGHV